MKLSIVFVLLIGVFLVLGCVGDSNGDDNSGTDCDYGETNSCTVDGCAGTRTCTQSGTWGTCVKTDPDCGVVVDLNYELVDELDADSVDYIHNGYMYASTGYDDLLKIWDIEGNPVATINSGISVNKEPKLYEGWFNVIGNHVYITTFFKEYTSISSYAPMYNLQKITVPGGNKVFSKDIEGVYQAELLATHDEDLYLCTIFWTEDYSDKYTLIEKVDKSDFETIVSVNIGLDYCPQSTVVDDNNLYFGFWYDGVKVFGKDNLNQVIDSSYNSDDLEVIAVDDIYFYATGSKMNINPSAGSVSYTGSLDIIQKSNWDTTKVLHFSDSYVTALTSDNIYLYLGLENGNIDVYSVGQFEKITTVNVGKRVRGIFIEDDDLLVATYDKVYVFSEV